MIKIRNITVAGLVSGALFTTALRGQDIVTAPATTEETTEAVGQSEVVGPTEGISPAAQLSPDDNSLRAGIAPMNAPVFDVARRMHFSASVLTGYDDNVNLTPNGSPSWFATPTGTFSYTFGSSRLALNLLAGAGITYYFDHPGGRDYDPNAHVQLSLAYKATSRLTFNFSTATSYQAQPDFSTALGVNRRLGNYFRSENRLSASYSFTPRLSSVTSYGLDALEYNSSEGSLQNRLGHSFGEALRFLLFPTTTVTGEYNFNFTDYANVANDSTTHAFAAGLDQSFSPHLIALVRGGLQLRSTENAGDRTSPYAEGTIRYIFGPGGSRESYSGSFISWTNRYSIEESDVVGGSSRETFRTNLQFSYAITARITASLALSYLHGDNQGSGTMFNAAETGSSTEDVFDVAPSVRYAITPHFALNVGYRHSESDRGMATDVQGSSFSRNRYFAGVELTF